MGTRLYVGNLSYDTTEQELQELFTQAGSVQDVSLPTDRNTGRSGVLRSFRWGRTTMLKRQFANLTVLCSAIAS